MDYWIIFPVALAVAFVVSAVDFWVYIVFWRSILGLAAAGLLLFWLGASGAGLAVSALASAFAAVAVIEVIERVTKIALPVRPR